MSESDSSGRANSPRNRSRSTLGCAVKSAVISVLVLIPGVYLLGQWEHLNGLARAGGVVLILIGAVFLIPPLLGLALLAGKYLFYKKVMQPLESTLEPARKMVEQNKKIYVERHVYRPANDADFTGRDRAWYDATTAQLQSMGFQMLGDVVNQTFEQAGVVTVIRRFVSADGTTMASIYHFVRPNKVTGAGMDLRICDFESELSDGTFVTTSNAEAAKAVTMPPQIRSAKHSLETPVTELLSLHESAKARTLAERGNVRFVEIRTMDDYMAAQDRQQAIKAAFRAGINYVDPQEVRRIAEQKFPDDPGAVATTMVAADIVRRQDQAENQP